MSIDIAKCLTPELMSRAKVQVLKDYINSLQSKQVSVDFSHVAFATRSFMDEFFNAFLKTPEDSNVKIELVNVPEDIAAMLNAVSKTQHGVKKTIQPTADTKNFSSAEEAISFLAT